MGLLSGQKSKANVLSARQRGILGLPSAGKGIVMQIKGARIQNGSETGLSWRSFVPIPTTLTRPFNHGRCQLRLFHPIGLPGHDRQQAFGHGKIAPILRIVTFARNGIQDDGSWVMVVVVVVGWWDGRSRVVGNPLEKSLLLVLPVSFESSQQSPGHGGWEGMKFQMRRGMKASIGRAQFLVMSRINA